MQQISRCKESVGWLDRIRSVPTPSKGVIILHLDAFGAKHVHNFDVKMDTFDAHPGEDGRGEIVLEHGHDPTQYLTHE